MNYVDFVQKKAPIEILLGCWISKSIKSSQSFLSHPVASLLPYLLKNYVLQQWHLSYWIRQMMNISRK